MTKKSVLGRGVGVLFDGNKLSSDNSTPLSENSSQPAVNFPEGITQEEDGSLSLEVERLVPNPHQPRKEFKEEALQELAESIREHGIIQPVTVEDAGDGQFYIIAGERRTRAARLAGLTIGLWKSQEELAKRQEIECCYLPQMENEERESKLKKWHRAVERSLGWELS